MEEQRRVDFFVSYTSPDRTWAEWIAWQLEQEGYGTTLQAWDFVPGSNWVREMDDAARIADRTIAVLSPAFLESRFAKPEWEAAFREDPEGKNRKLVPVRVRECEPKGLLGSIVYLDLVSKDETAARGALLNGVRRERAIPQSAPDFPGADFLFGDQQPAFPAQGPPIWNVPVHTRTFFGRAAELGRVGHDLAGVGTGEVLATQASVVHGLGGVGKTQLAARFAREHRDDYDVVWWIRAEQDSTRLSDYGELANRLGLAKAGEANPGEAVVVAKEWLERSTRWLLIFDNARDPQSIGELVPEGRAGHVLITSRRHADWGTLGAMPARLSVWEHRESVDFLKKRVGQAERDAAGAVAEALGGLPLALEQAAAYVNQQAITLADYCDRLNKRAPDLLTMGKPLGYEHTVATTWDLAFEEIRKQPLARELLVLCAFLSPERIPRELLTAYSSHDFDGDSQPQGVSIVEDAVEQLMAYALLVPGENRTLDMHRVVQRVVRAREPVDARQWASVAVSLLAGAFPTDIDEPERWPACARLLPHAVAASEHAEALGVATQATTALLRRTVWYLRTQAELSTARNLAEQVLAMCVRACGPEHQEVAMAHGNLGVVLQDLGEFSGAREAQERSLAIFERVYGPEHVEVAVTLGNLGLALQHLGELSEAREAQERSLAIFERVYGPEHRQVARTLGNLGDVLRQLADMPRARECLERAVVIAERVYGPDHPHLANLLSNLGLVLDRLGDLAGRRRSDERALAINERVYGPDHPRFAVMLGQLGDVMRQQGDLPGARDAHERALSILERVHGPYHPGVAVALGRLGLVLRDLAEFPRALEAQERALAILERVYGPDHLEVARTLGDLGNVMLGVGNTSMALELQERALAIKERAYGPDHPHVAITLVSLGSVLVQLGDLARAREAHERALVIEEVVYGPDHAEVAHTLSNLGMILKELGELPAAHHAQQRAQRIWANPTP